MIDTPEKTDSEETVEEWHKRSVEFPVALWRLLKEDADRSFRSVNSQAVAILSAYFNYRSPDLDARGLLRAELRLRDDDQ